MVRVGVRVLLCLATSLLITVATTGYAGACSCADLGLEEQVESADVVARVNVDKVDQPQGDNGLVTYHVSTTVVWKGEVPMRFSFVSARDGASCGLEGLTEGRDLLLFARAGGDGLPSRSPAALSSDLCSGTTLANAERVAQITDLLGEGTLPTQEEPPTQGTPASWWLESGWGPPAIVAISVVAVIVRRRLRGQREP